MSQTLLIHDNLPFIDIVKLNLSVYVGTDVIIKKNFDESKVLMEHHPGIDLIICADLVGEELTAELTVNFYEKLQRLVPIIVTGSQTSLQPSQRLKILPMRSELQMLLQTAAGFLNVTPKGMVEKVVPDFYPMSAYYCLNVDRAPCDIYFSDGDNGFALEYGSGEACDPREILAMMEAGLTTVFVSAKDRLKFVNSITESLNSCLQDEAADPKLKLGIADKSLQVLQDEALKGDSEVEQSVKLLAISAIKTCMQIAKHNPKVATLLRDLLANKTSFRFKHVQLTIYVCNHIVSHLEWGSSEVKEKLAFVAFFHDICISDDLLAKLNGETYATVANDLGFMDRELVLKHARMSAEIVQKFPVAPLGSDVIIMQHHGTLRGQGFTEHYSGDLSPLAMIFIVAEEFTHLILDQEHMDNIGAKKDEMIAKLHRKFPNAKFTKLIELLRKITF